MKDRIINLIKNNNFLSLTSNLSVAVFGFLGFLILVRTLAPEKFGEWVLYITAGNFLEMLRFGITRTAIVRFLSGATEDERKKIIGSNWVIVTLVTVFLALLLWSVYLLFPETIKNSGFSLFFIWYPVLSFMNLPFNNAQSILQADMRFDRLLWIKSLNVGAFVVFLVINWIFLKLGLMEILYIHLLINGLTSVVCVALGWDGIRYFFQATKATNRTILNFGKYTTGTLIGSNLLKSSDTFIIGLSAFLGPAGVAFYSVPLKLTEILEIPLRSFVATAFPRMSKASIENDIEEVKKVYYGYTGAMIYMLLPVIVIGFIFAEEFVIILGGREYVETANIFRVFCIYGLFIPLDKFTGVALDSINRPKKNFFKVMYMALANILGDSFVVFFLSKTILGISVITLLFNQNVLLEQIPGVSSSYTFITTLLFVAIVTIVFTLIGIIAGWYYLRKEININLKFVFIQGWFFLNYMVKSVTGKDLLINPLNTKGN